MLKDGFIQLHRKIVDWEWYQDVNTFRVFIHLLITVNYYDEKWQGILIKRGQRAASYSILASELNLSVKEIRTAINHLKRTGEVAHKNCHKYGLFTINNYDNYQSKADNKAYKGQSKGRVRAGEGQQINKANNNNKANKKDISPPAPEEQNQYPEGVEFLPDGTVSYANVKRVWD